MMDYVSWQADRACDSSEYWIECSECREGWFIELSRHYAHKQTVTCDNCNITWTEYINDEDVYF